VAAAVEVAGGLLAAARMKALLRQLAAPSQWGWRFVFWMALLSSFVLALWPASEVQPRWFAHTDKLGHAAMFALLMVLGRAAGMRRTWLLAAGLLAFGGAIELAQGLFTATRKAEWLDGLADAVGIAVGAIVWRRRGGRASVSRRLEQEHRG
jgi:VanZ family protein